MMALPPLRWLSSPIPTSSWWTSEMPGLHGLKAADEIHSRGSTILAGGVRAGYEARAA